MVGSASALSQDKHWGNLVNSAKERNCYSKVFFICSYSINSLKHFVFSISLTVVLFVQVTKPYVSFFSDENLKKMEVDLAQQKRDLKKAQALNAVHDEMAKIENMVAHNDNAEENTEDAQDYGMDGDGDGGGGGGGFGED